MLSLNRVHLFPLICISSLAKEDRRLYTLKPLLATTTPPLTPDAPITPTSKPSPKVKKLGPARATTKSKQARMRTGPLPPALKARVLANISKSKGPRANKTSANVLTVSLMDGSTNVNHQSDDEPATSQPPEDFLDSGSDTLAPLSSHSVTPLTDEMSVDEENFPACGALGAQYDFPIQIKIFPALGTSTLVETSPPTQFHIDKDERPRWLFVSIREFLQHGPYYLCLGEVVDLFLTQEARLGYLAKVRKFECLHPLTD